jgi:hypothetical protein
LPRFISCIARFTLRAPDFFLVAIYHSPVMQ